MRQKARLAALGTVVTKIKHDLRNILAPAGLVSDHLSSSDDTAVKRVGPTLLGAIDRAVTLCSQTLRFAGDETPVPERAHFALNGLLDDVQPEVVETVGSKLRWDNRVGKDCVVYADRDQLFRALSNLVRNALEAGAGEVRLEAETAVENIAIEIADDGPGLPKKVRERLFQPFSGAGRAGGTGLGLAIARDLMRGHGGDIELVETGE